MYKVLDLVWAKTKGYCPWPGVVCDPPHNVVKGPKIRNGVPSQCIFFFVLEKYEWIAEVNMWPYLEYRDYFLTRSKSDYFREAVYQIQICVRDPSLITEFVKLTMPDDEAEDMIKQFRENN